MNKRVMRNIIQMLELLDRSLDIEIEQAIAERSFLVPNENISLKTSDEMYEIHEQKKAAIEGVKQLWTN